MIPFVNGIGSLAVGFLLLTFLGNAVCRRLLVSTGLQKARDDLLAANPTPANPMPSGAGAWIGGLERVLIAAGLVGGAWEILVAVIALKTVARFKEIDQQIHAEYFLVGSLFSLVWAFGVTLAWRVYDASWGAHLTAWVSRVLG